MLPRQAEGLSIMNMKIWNKAAICKLLWCLNQKKDMTCVRWVHGYYIKHQEVYEMAIPQQCSWVVRKILGVRDHLKSLQHGKDWLQKSSFSIQKLYNELRGGYQKWPWAKMLCQNIAPPKCIFVTWLLLHGKLATSQYLQRIGITVARECSLCGVADETIDHLFFDCGYSRALWNDVMNWCGIARKPVQWRIEQEFLISQCTNNNKRQRLYRCVVAVLVYGLWMERNNRRMQGIRTTEDSVGKQCKNLLGWCSMKDRKLHTQLT